MKTPEFLTGNSLTRLLQGAAIGVTLTAAVGFNWTGYGFGWVTGGTAEKLATERTIAAVVKVMAPDCVRRFKQQADMAAQWAAFKKIDSWQRDTYIEKTGFATPIGSKEINKDVADACAIVLDEALKAQELKDKQAKG